MNETPHLLIATPSYQSVVALPYHLSSQEAFTLLGHAGIEVHEAHHFKDGLIARARMALLNTFISEPQYTHVMWIDNDLAYSWEDIVRLIAVDRDIVCGVYRKRMDTVSFPCVYMQDPSKPFVLDEKGCIELKRAPGGFVLMKRRAVMKMIRAYPERRCRISDGGWFTTNNLNAYDFFPEPVDESGMKQSEDYGFCDLWRQAGGQIWCLPDIELDHAGYRGKMSDWLKFEEVAA